jgi:hypothetical protein
VARNTSSSRRDGSCIMGNPVYLKNAYYYSYYA